MSFRRHLLRLAVLLSLAAGAAAAPAPARLTEDGADFVLLGQKTFRWMSVARIYDISLHLGAAAEPAQILRADIPLRLHLRYHRGFSARQIIAGGDTLLARNVEPAALEALRPRLEQLNRAYRDVGPGDTYTLTYAPGRGTTLRLNGEELVTVPGADFAAAYFRIWLGERPISPDLRLHLLGG